MVYKKYKNQKQIKSFYKFVYVIKNNGNKFHCVKSI